MTDMDLANDQLRRLRANRAQIVADLDVARILPFLLEELVLTLDDKERIEHEVTMEDKSNKLLNILETKATQDSYVDVISVFIESLRKNYDWLHKMLTDTDDVPDSKSKPSVEDDNVFVSPKHHKLRTMLEAGGVSCPLIAVERKEYVESVRHELQNLRRSQFLVIQGMVGCGKSILAQQALGSANLINNVFPDGVFVLPIGKECSESKDGLMAKMRILCERLEESRAPVSLEHGAEIIRAAFMKRPKSLLVLDGVWRSEVIKLLDAGCPTMVTTRDASIMDVVSGRAKFLKVDSGFSESESLELFRRTLKFARVEDLPEAAKAIHYTSRGSPMVVSLIASLFEDHPDETRDEGRWDYYLETLSKRKYSKIRRNRDYEHESIYDAISLSVDSLKGKKREYYGDFALFKDDVPIPCPVFELLWDLERYEVEDIMTHFVRKSLICEEIQPSRIWHVYSINCLQLDFLKHQLQRESADDNVGLAERKLHERLLTQYFVKCDNAYEKLPDDGYIHCFLGYHLYKAHQLSLFPQIYLNLLYIGEKLRLTGPADLLSDLRKYKEFIVGPAEEGLELFEEVQKFTELIGYIKYGQEDADIVQLALQNPTFELLQKQARELALAEPSRLYFEWVGADPKQWNTPESSTICSSGVRCVKFVGSTGEHFLAGLSDGSIELCDLKSCGVIWRYSGHKDTVRSITITTTSLPIGDNDTQTKPRSVFLSASEDETCKLWTTLDSVIELEGHHSKDSSRYSRSRSTDSSPSPKIHNNVWSFEKVQDRSTFTFQFHTAPVVSAEFSPSGAAVVSASSNEILVWSTISGEILYKNSPSSSLSNPSSSSIPPFLSCHFGSMGEVEKNPYLLLGTGNQLVLYSLQHTSICSSVEASNMNIVSVLFFAPDWICAVSEHDIGLWKIDKGESQNIIRRKSLSPRRSFNPFPGGKTAVDAKSMNNNCNGGGSNSGQFLLPPTKLEKFTNGHRAHSLTSSASGHNLVFTSLSAIIDTGEFFIRILREHIIPKRIAGLFQCAAITQDHNDLLLACGTSNMKICLFNLLTKEFLGEFNTYSGLLRCLDFSKVDEWTLLSGSEDQTVMLWDVTEEIAGKKVSRKRSEFASIFVGASRASEPNFFLSMFSTDANTIQFYRDEALLLETNKTNSEISAVCLSPIGALAVFGTDSGHIYRVPIPDAKELKPCNDFLSLTAPPQLIGDFSGDRVGSLTFDPTVEFLIATSSAGTVHIFKQFQLHHSLQLDSYLVVSIHFPFNKYLAIISGQKSEVPVTIIDLETKAEMKGLDSGASERGHDLVCSAMKLDSSALAVGTRDNGIYFCSLRLGVGVLRVTGIPCKQKSAIRSLAFSPDADKLAVGFKNGLITVYGFSSASSTYVEEQNLVLHKSAVRLLLFSPFEIGERRWLVSLGDRLAVWSLEKPTEQIQKTSFMAERRRRKSGDSRPSSRLSLELPSGIKIGKKGKRELLNSFSFRGSYATHVKSDAAFQQFVTVDDTGIFYLLKVMKEQSP